MQQKILITFDDEVTEIMLERLNSLLINDETLNGSYRELCRVQPPVIQNTRQIRNKNIFADRLNGLTFKEIAEKYSISYGRATQIFKMSLIRLIRFTEVKQILCPDGAWHKYDIKYWQDNKDILLGYFA